MTDLTAEQLDRLERAARTQKFWPWNPDERDALIAMARDKQAAEEAVAFLQGEHEDAVRWQVRAESAERERDALVGALASIQAGHRECLQRDGNVCLAAVEAEVALYHWRKGRFAQSTDAGGAE